MAEARQATDVYYVQKRHLRTRHEGYITLTLSVPTLSTAAAQVGLFTHRLKYALLNRLWPASPLTLVTVMSGVTYMTVTAKGESWVRSGWLAEALWRVDTVVGRLNPLHARLSTEVRVGYLAATAAFVGMLGIVSVERLILRFLLSWQGWLFGTSPKWVTTIWGILVKMLTGSKNLTYAFHMSLPTLPVPNLKRTCERFLSSVHALYDEAEYAKMEELVRKFLANEGPRLQRYLWLKWLTSSNYVLDWWEQYVYLAGRSPIAINSNYYALDSKYRPTNNQLERAANTCHSFLRFKDLVESETLEPMTIRGLIPLCMSQYKRMFGTSRIPGRDMDELQHTPYSRYFVVCCKGLFYKLPCYHGATGTMLKPYSPKEILTQLEMIVKHASQAVKELPDPAKSSSNSPFGLRRGNRIQSFEDLVVMDQLRQQRGQGGLNHSASTTSFQNALHAGSGSNAASSTKQSRIGRNVAAFTAGPRSRWAEVRELYFSDGINRKSLDTIEKAAFVLHINDVQFDALSEKALFAFCKNPSNWYDKSINLNVYTDGYMAINCEHAWADAPAIAHLWEYSLLSELHMYENGTHAAAPAPATDKKTPRRKLMPPTLLKFAVDDELQIAIDQAHSFIEELAADVDLRVVEHLAYGKGLIKKKAKCSPDGFIQMALQATYFSLTNRLDLVYESSMTRLFRGGRTETTRSLSDSSAAFVHAFDAFRKGSSGDKTEVIKLLRAATTEHANQNKECMAGKGIDRHLFALYVVSRGLDVDSEFLKTALSIPWTLSSSQQPQEQTDLRKTLKPEIAKRFISPGGGFGPVAEAGYGISYMFASEDQFFFHISSKKSAEETSSDRFADELMRVLDEMSKLFD
ncbi:Carnitine O-palmitoyltransferase 1, muscle isoform [Hondaea fermentalgiana]|uniref:Carnitine O-palmitoyltransferase 1, muscle isoform n=1 Tax=Hondaea fermentalgiana TaxID=2315210 RepID=A0A2R5G9U4_9STRA|nr:Carnitine O-palmitoyltransferase 1, muscle isoform [Hondaea fermentalgiana]|eukprot:GBG25303.1 Carnitine O-palmitoyltransferase 1, muscle isoform [Hondaea fermentalgiana]